MSIVGTLTNKYAAGDALDDEPMTVMLHEGTLLYGGAWYDTGRGYHDRMLRWFYHEWADRGPFTILDIGASTGAYSLLAAHMPGMTAYAFEPCLDVYQVLKKNIALNLLRRVNAYPVAMSDAPGEMPFYHVEPESQAGLSQLGGTPRAEKSYRVEQVMVTTVDSFTHYNHIERVDVLKIDTEGSELAVLRGALGVLERDHPMVIAEYSDANANQYGYNAEAIAILLRELGYTVRYDHEDVIATWTV